jgi:hypothetical protein
MRTPIASSDGAPLLVAPAGEIRSRWDVAVWACASLLAAFFACLVRDAAVLDDTYLPTANDSFYHARRILDAAVGPRGFFQFDERLQVPEGAWIPWPWAYDWLMAKATQLALWLHPALDPMAFISYVPVAWILVNAALFMAACRAIGLSPEMRLVAMLAFALSPLTQLLHAVGMIDHHYVEHTFVLLAVWLGIRWFEQRDDRHRAIALGIALGIAPGFHTGLFILQLLPLAVVFLLWLRGNAPRAPVLWAFGIALVAATELVLLPSEPYRRFMFEFGLLSWFHFYVALCSAGVMAFMGWQRASARSFAGLGVLSALLAAPLAQQVLSGAGFLSGSFSIQSEIREVHSPLHILRTDGPVEAASYYSWLLLIAPGLLAFYAWRIVRERAPERLYYAAAVVFGLAMLLSQLRLQYFGFFGFVTSGLLLLDGLRKRQRWHRGATFLAALALLVLAYQPVLRERLFIVYAPGADVDYASAYAIFLDLNRLCAEDPGVVLASPDDGNAILFHTDCSVIANNFILRPADKAHIDEVDRLMRLPPEEILRQRRDVKYVFVRARDFSAFDGDVATLAAQNPIARELFIDEEPPEAFSLVKTVRTKIGEQGVDGIYARLYKVSN